MENCKIMVVDDEYLPRQNIINIMDWEKYGFTIVGEMASAKSALEFLRENKCDVVLCDIVMPNVDGIELSKIVRKKYPSIEIVILSGYDNFDYVKTAFKYGVTDYILKPTLTAKQLIDILLPIQQRLGKDVDISKLFSYDEDVSISIYRMLEGGVINKELIESHFDLPEYTFICYETSYTEDIDTTLIRDKISSIFKDFKHYFVCEQEGVSIYILNHNFEDRFKLDLKWDELKGYLKVKGERIFGMKIDSIGTNDELLRGYECARLMHNNFFYGGKKKYLKTSLDDIEEANDAIFDFSEFMKRADCNSPSIALIYLNEYLESLDKHNSMSVRELKAVVQNCIYNITNLIQIAEEYHNELNTQKILFFNNISKAMTLERVKKEYSDICSYIYGLINEQMGSDSVMLKIEDYIYNHYMEPISLQDIAGELYMSYSYLSTYFNKHHDVCFNDYLNQIRVSKAKEYLLDRKAQISQVSDKVGYSSQGYFTKVFKKVEGLTPTQYRKKYLR